MTGILSPRQFHGNEECFLKGIFPTWSPVEIESETEPCSGYYSVVIGDGEHNILACLSTLETSCACMDQG
jgi:hypothetical protein